MLEDGWKNDTKSYISRNEECLVVNWILQRDNAKSSSQQKVKAIMLGEFSNFEYMQTSDLWVSSKTLNPL